MGLESGDQYIKDLKVSCTVYHVICTVLETLQLIPQLIYVKLLPLFLSPFRGC